jgi:HK97 family phage prohead protease
MAETFRVPKGVQDEAKMALRWITDGHAGSGFTAVGKKRASDLAAGHPVSAETILRMYSFFKRHEVDKRAEGFNSGENGFPSPGRVAWSAWGGDAGFDWSTRIRNQISKSARALSLMASEEGDMADMNQVPDLNEELTELLADVVSFYFRAHGAHWNVKGADFSEYHKLFLKIYEDVYESIDPIAENLRKLGSLAPFTLGSFLALRTIDDASTTLQDPIALANDLLSANDIVLDELSDAFDCATLYNQQGVANFLAGRIDQHQFWKWQLTASLGQEVTQPSPDPVDAQGIDEDDQYDQVDDMLSEQGLAPMPIMPRMASGASDLEIAPRDTAWDAAAADKRVQEWAGGDKIDFDKYAQAFFYVDETKKNLLGSYKLQFADIIDGSLVAVPKGIFAVAGVLNGARGGVNIPDSDAAEIKDKVAAYYARLAKQFNDDSIKAPFEGRASAARIGEGSFVSWNTSNGRAKGKVEKVVTKGQAKSSEGYVLETTPDQPAFSIRIYKEQGNGWIPSDITVVHRPDILTVITALPAPRSEETSMIESRKAMETAERITMTAEVRAVATDDGSLKIGGYAATFNQEADGLNFREQIAPGAFTRALASGDPVFLLVNHDMEGIPLASTQSGTLQLRQDTTGLYIEATLDSANPKAQELSSALRRGDMDKMSFAFTVSPDGQTRDAGLRTINDIERLYEVSVVTLPAYNSTSVGMRSAEEIDLELAKRKLQLKVKHYSLTRKGKA